jgi:hypothetical protein
MDPIQFRVDWGVLSEVLITIIVLAFFVERALSIVTESKVFINSRFDDNGTKEILSLVLSLIVVKLVSVDALAILFKLDAPTWPGYLVTAGIVAGGSKASIKFFHDLMDVRSSAQRQKDELKKAQRKTQLDAVARGVQIDRIV